MSRTQTHVEPCEHAMEHVPEPGFRVCEDCEGTGRQRDYTFTGDGGLVRCYPDRGRKSRCWLCGGDGQILIEADEDEEDES